MVDEVRVERFLSLRGQFGLLFLICDDTITELVLFYLIDPGLWSDTVPKRLII